MAFFAATFRHGYDPLFPRLTVHETGIDIWSRLETDAWLLVYTLTHACYIYMQA